MLSLEVSAPKQVLAFSSLPPGPLGDWAQEQSQRSASATFTWPAQRSLGFLSWAVGRGPPWQGHSGVTGDGVGRAAGSQWPCNDIRGPRCSGGDLALAATWWVARATFRTCSPCVSPASPLSSSMIQLSTDGTEGLRLVTPHAGRVSHGCTHRRQEGFRNPGGPETWKWCTPLLEASLFSGEELQANTTEGPHLGV